MRYPDFGRHLVVTWWHPFLSPFYAVPFATGQLKDPGFSALIPHLDGPVLSSVGSLLGSLDVSFRWKAFCIGRTIPRWGLDYLWLLLNIFDRKCLCRCTTIRQRATRNFLKTSESIRLRYFWPRLYTSVYKYVTSCLICQRWKSSTSATAGLYNQFHWLPRFWTVGY